MSEPRCETCRYSHWQGGDGKCTYCRRYPQELAVPPYYWCGEWRAREAEDTRAIVMRMFEEADRIEQRNIEADIIDYFYRTPQGKP